MADGLVLAFCIGLGATTGWQGKVVHEKAWLPPGEAPLTLNCDDKQAQVSVFCRCSLRLQAPDTKYWQRELRITNAGPQPVLLKHQSPGQPWIWALDSLLADLLVHSHTPSDSALALFRFAANIHQYKDGLRASAGAALHDPLAYVHHHQYGYCDDAAALLVRLALFAGMRARVVEMNGHVVAELHFADQWHLYDPAMAWLPMRGGQVASLAEVVSEGLLDTAGVFSGIGGALLMEAYMKPQQHRINTAFYLQEPLARSVQAWEIPPGQSLCLRLKTAEYQYAWVQKQLGQDAPAHTTLYEGAWWREGEAPRVVRPQSLPALISPTPSTWILIQTQEGPPQPLFVQDKIRSWRSPL